jgi:hypothetical protein
MSTSIGRTTASGFSGEPGSCPWVERRTAAADRRKRGVRVFGDVLAFQRDGIILPAEFCFASPTVDEGATERIFVPGNTLFRNCDSAVSNDGDTRGKTPLPTVSKPPCQVRDRLLDNDDIDIFESF